MSDSEIMEFTPIQMKILEILSDGQRHSRHELITTVWEGKEDDEPSRRVLGVHLVGIRKLLRQNGQTVLCEFYQRSIYYRHVRLLCGPEIPGLEDGIIELSTSSI